MPSIDRQQRNSPMNRTGLLIILSSPSGAGKSTLARRLRTWDPSLSFSISATTRPARPGEVDGEHYHFIALEKFREMVEAGQMLEHAEVFGNYYGSPRGPVETAISDGRDTLFDVDWQGGQQIRASALGAHVVSVFVLPPSLSELERRLRNRGQDSDEGMAGRMEKSRAEISHWAEYDYVVINSDIAHALSEIRTILHAERLKRDRQTGLVPFVRDLMNGLNG